LEDGVDDGIIPSISTLPFAEEDEEAPFPQIIPLRIIPLRIITVLNLPDLVVQ
jgi:hypothetical protein